MTGSKEGALRNLRPIVMAALTRGSSNGPTAGADGDVMGLTDGCSRGVLIQAFTFGLRKDQRRGVVIELGREAMLDASQGAAVGRSREWRGEGCRSSATGRGPGAMLVFPTRGEGGEGAMGVYARARLEAGTIEVVRPKIGVVVARTWAST